MFIVIEGIDGCGKGTQLDLLEKVIKDHGNDVVRVHDPGSTPLGTAIRELLLHRTEIGITGIEQLLLFTTARAALARHIRELLEAGKHVLCDRWVLSTMVYQGDMFGMDLGLIHSLHNQCVGLDPDLYVVLDVPVEVAKARCVTRRVDRFEANDVEWYERLRAGYRAHHGLTSVRVIDGNDTPEAVSAHVLDCCRRLLAFRKLLGEWP